MLVEHTVKQFSDVLSSNSPAPGGGSVAALAGALGADLITMVCNLTIGKKGYEDFTDILHDVLGKSQQLSTSLMKRVDLDTEAFNDVMAAFKMPKDTEDEKRARTEAIQAGYKEAVQSPLSIAMECLEVLQSAELLIGKFNQNTMSDFGVGAEMAQSGLEGAVMNVKINLPSIKNGIFVADTKHQVAKLLEDGAAIRNKIYNYVHENID